MSDETTSPARIVVGVDGSEPSKAALSWAVRQAELTGGTVEAIMAWELPVAYSGLVVPTTPPADYQHAAGERLAQVFDEAIGPERRVEVRPRAVQGHPAAVLLDASRAAQLLVVGNRGHGGFTEALLGSVGQHCVHHASCPVVVVRGQRG
jgi:nucleotide-binding universal stress UspA family protein